MTLILHAVLVLLWLASCGGLRAMSDANVTGKVIMMPGCGNPPSISTEACQSRPGTLPLTILNPHDEPVGEIQPDESGAFQLRLKPGHYRLRIPRLFRSNLSNFSVQSGENHFVIRLTPVVPGSQR